MLHDLGFVAQQQGEYGQAHALYTQSLALFRELGDKRGIAYALHDLGFVAQQQGEYARACALLVESLTLAWDTAEKYRITEILADVAAGASAQGQAARAARLWGAGARLREDIGAKAPPNEHTRYERYLATARAHLDAATFAAAWAEGRAMSLEEAIAYALADEQ